MKNNLPNFSNVYLPTSYDLSVAIKGNGKTLGITEGLYDYALCRFTDDLDGARGLENQNYGINPSGNPPVVANKTVGVITDSSKSGLTGTTIISRMTTQKWIIKY